MTYDLLQNERYRYLIGFVPFELQNLAKVDTDVPICLKCGKYSFKSKVSEGNFDQNDLILSILNQGNSIHKSFDESFCFTAHTFKCS